MQQKSLKNIIKSPQKRKKKNLKLDKIQTEMVFRLYTQKKKNNMKLVFVCRKTIIKGQVLRKIFELFCKNQQITTKKTTDNISC